MAHTFLLEIGLEEIPAHVVTPSVNQLVAKVENYLKEERLAFDSVLPFSTPRRLAVKVTGLADKQEDISTEAKGPAKKIAQDAEGNWTKAAQGFARGQGLTTDDLFFKELKGVEYVYANKFEAGKSALEVLAGMKEVAMSLKFPTMMRWGTNDFEYVRPIRWLVALLDNEVVNFDILGTKTGRVSQGHRFLGKEVTLNSTDDYPEALLAESVIADATKRKNMIRGQINDLAQENGWKVDIDEDLLEEVNNLVEWPTVFAGNFDEKYLAVPDVVLITSMKDNQRYFYVTDAAGKLLPHFIAIRNGKDAFLNNVIAGNEKVLTARLEDAKFFFEEDQKQSLQHYVDRLDKVMFHDKIGTLTQKMQRVGLLAQFLGQKLGLSDQELADLARASQIYKFDLVTGMVGEFSELQGVMGEIYANLMGENAVVAQAIREEYMPTSAEGVLPASTVGSVLSIADKLDSLQAFFSAGMVPSGSNDPYALRRQTLGIIRIALANNWQLSVDDLMDAVAFAQGKAHDLYANIDPATNAQALRDFVADRLHQILANDHYRHDVLETVVANMANTFVDVSQAAKTLTAHLDDADFKETIEALTRVARLADKADLSQTLTVDESLFENDSEKALFAAYQVQKEAMEAANDYDAKYQAIHALKDAISAYFEATMVMVEDTAVKNNRLHQLVLVKQLTQNFGDLAQLNVK